MNKKKYQKPDMTVYRLKRKPRLLYDSPADGPGVYIPHLDGGMNQKA